MHEAMKGFKQNIIHFQPKNHMGGEHMGQGIWDTAGEDMQSTVLMSPSLQMQRCWH